MFSPKWAQPGQFWTKIEDVRASLKIVYKLKPTPCRLTFFSVCELERNTIFLGPYTPYTTKSGMDCLKKCVETSRCFGATWDKGNSNTKSIFFISYVDSSNCYLFNQRYPVTKDNNYLSYKCLKETWKEFIHCFTF